jgi:hypothetical protein
MTMLAVARLTLAAVVLMVAVWSGGQALWTLLPPHADDTRQAWLALGIWGAVAAVACLALHAEGAR